jgi:hypothetical protein
VDEVEVEEDVELVDEEELVDSRLATVEAVELEIELMFILGRSTSTPNISTEGAVKLR